MNIAEREHLSDSGNARRLALLHGRALRWVPAWRSWLYWTDKYWKRDETGEVMRRAKAMVASIYADAAAEPDEVRRRAVSQHALKSESLKALTACVELLKSEPGIAVGLEELDQDPFALNLANGTLQLGKAAALKPHDPADLITRIIPVEYDPAAQAPTWLAFLARIFGGREALVRFMQRAAGYALTGDTRERVLFILHGVGANGKSTFSLVLQDLLGPYAATMHVETLLAGRRDATAMNDVLDVVGARFVTAVEPDLGRRLAEGFVKAMTGGEAISVKRLYSDIAKATPLYKLFLSTNHKPEIRGTDPAIWSRIRLVPFDVVIPDHEQDKTLRARLRAEAPGILAWVVEGCLAWQLEGLRPPAEVAAATAAYRAEMDRLAGFLLDRCVVESDAWVSAGALYAAYRAWATTAEEEPLSPDELGLKLAERGFTRKRTKQARGWAGLRLRIATDGATGDGVTGRDALLTNSSHARAGGKVMENGATRRHPSPAPGAQPGPGGGGPRREPAPEVSWSP